MSHNKRLPLILAALIVGALLLLGKQISRALTITTAPTNQPLISPVTTDIPNDVHDQIFGNPGAALSIVEFSDIGCAECQKIHTTLTAFVAAHPADARLIWKDAPNRSLFFKEYTPAHVAAYCAGKQNKFWDYVNAIIKDKKYSSASDLMTEATNLKLNTVAFDACTKDPVSTKKIADARILADQLRIVTSPVIFVNNKRLTLTPDVDLSQLLEAFIAP
jgi:protein-disulfide isomerase